jgi:hypothetical protein
VSRTTRKCGFEREKVIESFKVRGRERLYKKERETERDGIK